ncbi:MAG: Hint domain-containing protein [Pseudomonadota bacterium]
MGMYQPLVLRDPLPEELEEDGLTAYEELLSPHPLTHPERVTVSGFAPGTQIDTPDGPRRVEDLLPGDLIETIDDGPCLLARVGTRDVPGASRLAAVLIQPGALGNSHALRVSPGKQILIQEAFVTAGDLVNGSTITRDQGAASYHYIQFDRAHVVTANGVDCGIGGPSALSLMDLDNYNTDRMPLV